MLYLISVMDACVRCEHVVSHPLFLAIQTPEFVSLSKGYRPRMSRAGDVKYTQVIAHIAYVFAK